jgi:outer membrane protein assembly factor BamD
LLEQQTLAENALLVLRNNYPDHSSLDVNGNFNPSRSVRKTEKSWLNVLSLGLFG